MAAKRFSLDAAHRLRRSERVRAEGELARARVELGRAELELAHARAALATHLRAAPAHPRPVAAGRSLRALDLQRAAAFAGRHAQRTEQLRAAARRASADVRRAHAAVRAASEALANSGAQERALDREHDRFVREARKLAEAARDEELEEQRAAFPRGGRPRPS